MSELKMIIFLSIAAAILAFATKYDKFDLTQEQKNPASSVQSLMTSEIKRLLSKVNLGEIVITHEESSSGGVAGMALGVPGSKPAVAYVSKSHVKHVVHLSVSQGKFAEGKKRYAREENQEEWPPEIVEIFKIPGVQEVTLDSNNAHVVYSGSDEKKVSENLSKIIQNLLKLASRE